MPTPTTPATTSTPDTELAALGRCLKLLAALSDEQRQRVLWWLLDRHFGPAAVEAAKARLAAGA